MDTHHLLRLRDVLEAELRQKGRLSWAQEEFETAAAVERAEKEFDTEGFRRIKGNRELSLQDQVVLRALYLFRDKMARKLDVPPFKVLNNSVLLDLVQRPPQSPREMFNRPGISNRVARKYRRRNSADHRGSPAAGPVLSGNARRAITGKPPAGRPSSAWKP